jgi:hypothetical protein
MIEFKNDYVSIEKSINATDSNNDDIYQKRINRIYTLGIRTCTKYNKVIIPYDFDKKKYIIKLKDIEFYEHKTYLIQKIDNFCNLQAFHIDERYKPNSFEKLYIIILYLGIVLLIAYFLFIIATLFSYNPLVIYTAFTWLRKGYLRVQVCKFVLLEKWKIKKMNKVLESENKAIFCKENKLKWQLGQSGYWIEIQKLIE